ncbi:MAG: lipoyl synthase [Candidatus Micrarchaeia archaeon]
MCPQAPKPQWLKIPLPNEKYASTKMLLDSLGIVTVCREAKCPNVNECWGNGTATFMILGDTCTRGCRFCNTRTAQRGREVDTGEAKRIAAAIRALGLKYAVITSVDRDDLEDLGAGHFARCIREARLQNPSVKVEVLTPDFQGRAELIDIVCDAGPHVFGHNIETVRRLTPKVRDLRASYAQSLAVLRHAAQEYPQIIVKSALMVGMGESEDEVCETLADLRDAGVKAVAIGQYLQPTPRHYPVAEYVPPEQFEKYANIAREMGFEFVASGPLVRSSYRAWGITGGCGH